LVAVLSISSASIITKLINAPSSVIAFWRLAISTALMYLISLGSTSFKCVSANNLLKYVLGSGFFLGLHFIFWIESLKYIPIAVSVTLVTTYPAFTAVESTFILGEGLVLRQYLGILISFIGIAVMFLGDAAPSTSPYGVLLALLGSLTASLYFLFGRCVRRLCGLFEYVIPTYSVAALTTLAPSLALGYDILNYPLGTWALFLLLAVGPMICGHTVLNYLLRFMKAATVATIAVCEPIGASLLALILLGEVPPPNVVVGMLITVLGVWNVVSAEVGGG